MIASLDALLDCFPRTRPVLPEAYRRIYAEEYKLNREGTKAVEGLAKRVEGWMHRQVARKCGGPTLELGAGTLNHLCFETDLTDYDAVEPFTQLYANSPRLKDVRLMFSNLIDIPDEHRYARIISVAVLEHMENLPADLAKSAMHLQHGGVFQAGIPSEGGVLWGLGWRCTTGATYWLRNRLNYGVLMRHEHINTAPEILTLVRALFRTVKVKRFPLPFQHLSLYAYVEASDPRLDVAEQWLSKNGASS